MNARNNHRRGQNSTPYLADRVFGRPHGQALKTREGHNEASQVCGRDGEIISRRGEGVYLSRMGIVSRRGTSTYCTDEIINRPARRSNDHHTKHCTCAARGVWCQSKDVKGVSLTTADEFPVCGAAKVEHTSK